MSILNVSSSEPLYIVIVRDPQAEILLKSWVKENRAEHTQVNGNRLLIFNQHAFTKLCITWNHNWEITTVWDTWNRRHIYV